MPQPDTRRTWKDEMNDRDDAKRGEKGKLADSNAAVGDGRETKIPTTREIKVAYPKQQPGESLQAFGARMRKFRESQQAAQGEALQKMRK